MMLRWSRIGRRGIDLLRWMILRRAEPNPLSEMGHLPHFLSLSLLVPECLLIGY